MTNQSHDGRGYVYLIRSEGTATYRIGFTKRKIDERIKEIPGRWEKICCEYVSKCIAARKELRASLRSFYSSYNDEYQIPKDQIDSVKITFNLIVSNYKIIEYYQSNYENFSPHYEEESYNYGPGTYDNSDNSMAYIIGVIIAGIFLLAGLASTNPSSSKNHQRPDTVSPNITIGNAYQVHCIDGYTHVRLRNSPSLNAPVNADIACGETVVVTGQARSTDIYWYPVRTSKGLTGFMAKEGIDP